MSRWVTGYCGVCVYDPEYGDCTCCGCHPDKRNEDGVCRDHEWA